MNLFRLKNGNSTNHKFTRRASLLIPLVLVCIGLSLTARAVSPAPDGGYPGFNTAEGDLSLDGLTIGTQNTALGFQALFNNTSGNNNTSIGVNSLWGNKAGGDNNTATGNSALQSNTTGSNNTATGNVALLSNMTGSFNTAVGGGALRSNQTGTFNTAVGQGALRNSVDTFHNIAIGANAGTTFVHAINSIAIGVPGEGPFADGSETCFIASINGQPTSDIGSTVPVFIDKHNVLGTSASSRHVKHDIKPMDKASEVILALKPVTFKYNTDAKGTPCFGLIAEEVAEVSPDLVVRNKNGEPWTVRYEQINAMLLNEFLKEHCKVEKEEATIADLKSTVAEQQNQIKALASGLRKVSNQLELSKAAPQIVVENQYSCA